MAGIDSDTVLMLHCDGANGSTTFTDSSPTPKTVTANGNAQVSTAQAKFDQSALFDGNGDYLAVTDHSDFTWAGQFTIECWIKTSNYSRNTYYRRVISLDQAIELAFFNGSGASPNISFLNATFNVITGSINAADGNWHHIALTRDASNDCRLFVDGVQSGSTANTSLTFNPTNIHIGQYSGGGGGYFDGYIDEIRFSKVARWNSNFTPPSSPYNTGNVLAAEAATYTLTVFDAALRPARNLVASAASFALTANAATLRTELKLPAAGASYALTAFDAALRPAFKLAAAAASYTLTANAAALTRTGVLQAAAASYTLTANAATLARSYDFDADAASYTLTAYDAQLYSGQRLQAAGATFTLTAYAASPYAIRYLYPEAAVYTLTAFPATLRKSYLALAAAGAAFTLSAQDARLSFDRRLVAVGATFTLDAKELTLTHGYWLHAEGASFVLSPGEAVLSQARRRINMFPVAY